MAIGKPRNRAKAFERLAKTGAHDFDPEADDVPAEDSEDESASNDDSGDENDGREHYVTVGKSKLRKPKEAPLGPQYRGSKVNREGWDDEEEDDPFSRGFDEEESSDDEGGDLMREDDSDEDEAHDGADTDETDLSDQDARLPNAKLDDRMLRAELASATKDNAQRAVTNSISRAARVDAEKGRAVKKQRTAFDSLLNTRMKLQKALVALNTLVGTPAEQIEAEKADAQQALDAAETAAFNLWNSLNSFRQDLIAPQTGVKRKRATFTIDTSTDELWSHVRSQEASSRPQRDANLSKWSTKAQVASQSGHLAQHSQTTIIDALQEQLTNPDRLLKRVHAPRSCAPLQASQRISEDEKIFDDADFYGLLLKELLERKSADSVAASNIDLGFQMRRENKTKRNVDTKASKGRKLRYTVHEKLQNYMAPENRLTWNDRQADELFGSLFGQKMGLKEDEDDDEEKEGDIDMEEAGLMMFRS